MGASLLNCLASSARDDHEFSYFGSLGAVDTGGSIRTGYYRLRKGSIKEKSCDIAVKFAVQKLNGKIPTPENKLDKLQVMVLIEELDLSPLDQMKDSIGSDDLISIDCLCGPSDTQGKNFQHLEWNQPYRMNKQAIGNRVKFKDAVIYRGPYGNGIPIQFSLMASDHDLSKEIDLLLKEAADSAAPLFPRHEDLVRGIAAWASQLHAAVGMLRKKIKFSVFYQSVISCKDSEKPMKTRGNPEEDPTAVILVDLFKPDKPDDNWIRMCLPLIYYKTPSEPITIHLKLKIGKIG